MTGIVMERKMSGLPTKRCWKVGPTKKNIKMGDALYFNEQWETNIQLWKHDCRHHTTGMWHMNGQTMVINMYILSHC